MTARWSDNSYRAHQKFDLHPRSYALDILGEQYQRGEFNRDQYDLMKSEITKA